MKLHIVLYIIMICLGSSLAMAWYEPLHLWELDTNANDTGTYSNNLADIGGAVSYVPGKIGNGASITGGKYLKTTTFSNASAIRTMDCWVKPTSTLSWDTFIGLWYASGFYRLSFNDGDRLFTFYNGKWEKYTAENWRTANKWYHIVQVVGPGGQIVYYNGTATVISAETDVFTADYINLALGNNNGGTQPFEGIIDNCAFFAERYSQANVTASYNNGDGINFSAIPVPPGPEENTLKPYLILPINNTYDTLYLQDFNFNYTGNNETSNADLCGLFTNETGALILEESLTTGLTQNTTLNISHTFTTEGVYLWNIACNSSEVNLTYATNNYTVIIDTTSPSIISNIEDNNTYWTGDFNLQINITEINPKNITVVDSCNWTYINASYTGNPYNLDFNFTNTSLCGLSTQETNVTVCDLAGYCNSKYYLWDNMGLLNISAYSGVTDTAINSFSISVNDILEGSTSVGNYTLGNLTGGTTVNITINALGYELKSLIYNVTNTEDFYNFTLYDTNSLNITIYDETTGEIIGQNVTMVFSSSSSTFTNITNSSTAYFYNLTATEYQAVFFSSGYSNRTYIITVGNRSHQFIDIYLAAGSSTTLFTITDSNTEIALTDVLFTVSKLLTDQWVTVESKYSDITGRVKISYAEDTNYRFYLSKTGYDDLIFYLNPIIFSSYNIKMDINTLLNYSFNLDNIAIVYGPQIFNNSAVTNFTFLINSPYGSLTSYGVNLTYPGGSNYVTGSNAIGGTLTSLVNISNATVFDTVRLEYFYTTTISGRRNFTDQFPITFPEGTGTNTFMANKNKTFGLGIFERVLTATLIAIFIVGIASLVGQPVPGFALNLLIQSYLTYIGFIPIWITLPSLLLGLFIIIWKSGGT